VNAKTSNHDIALDIITITSGSINNWRIGRDLAPNQTMIQQRILVCITALGRPVRVRVAGDGWSCHAALLFFCLANNPLFKPNITMLNLATAIQDTKFIVSTSKWGKTHEEAFRQRL
jgi:hypothetical protein